MRKISRRNFLLASGAVTISAAAERMRRLLFFYRRGILCRSFFRRFRCSGSPGQGAEYLVLERRVPGPLQ